MIYTNNPFTSICLNVSIPFQEETKAGFSEPGSSLFPEIQNHPV